MSDDTLDKLLEESFLRKQEKEKSFADLYDIGYRKNDMSVNDTKEIFDAEKVLGKNNEDFGKLPRDFKDEEWDKLQSVHSTDATDSEIQSLSNAQLFEQMPIDTTAALLVNRKNEAEKRERLKRTEPATTESEALESTHVAYNEAITNRPKGHPANSQKSGYIPYDADQNRQRTKENSYISGKSRKQSGSVQRDSSEKNGHKAPKTGRAREKNKQKYDNESKKSGENKINYGSKSRKKSKVKKVLIVVVIVILVLFGLISALILRYAGMLNIVESKQQSETVEGVVDASGVENILLLGSDTRNEESGRSDTMILVSINSKTDKIVQTSFMRDILVSIPGYGYAKLNAAYAYGGAELVMDTIEQNFKIKVDKYMHIDFLSFVDIIDAVGGLELTVNDDEALAMNDPMNEVNDILGRAHDTGNLSYGGTYHMDGVQSLAYARIRYAGDGDFDRTGRQREVIEKIIERLKDLSIFEMNKALETILPEITTNMSKTEIYFLCLRLPFIMGYDMTQFRVPYGEQGTGFWNYGDYSGESVLDIDFDKNNSLLKSVVVDGEEVDE